MSDAPCGDLTVKYSKARTIMPHAISRWASSDHILYLPPFIQPTMKFFVEKSRYYLGTAQIAVQNLYYSEDQTESDACSGCCISDLEHNLPALVEPSDIYQAIASLKIPGNALYQVGPPPRLPLPSSLE